MTAETIIEEIRKLPQKEVDKVADYFEEIEAEHNKEAWRRGQELDSGTVKGITKEEVFDRLSNERKS